MLAPGSPTIIIGGTTGWTTFTNVVGTPSSVQQFTASGIFLTNNCTITVTGTGLEVSLDGVTYSGTTLTISQSGGQLVSQPVFVSVRVAAATTVGSYSGNIVASSTGATPVNIPYSATVSAATTSTVVLKGTVGNVASLVLNLTPYYTTYDYFRVYIYNLTPVSNGADFYLTYSPDASTYSNTNYSWRWESGGNNNGSNFDAQVILFQGVQNNAGYSAMGDFSVAGTNQTSFWQTEQGNFGYINSFGNSTVINSAGYLAINQLTKSFKLAFSTGNIATLTYKVEGFFN